MLQCRLVGLQIEPSTANAKFPNELVVDQTVLSCNLRCSIFGSAAADAVGLHQGIVHPRLRQLIGTQKSSHTAADNQHVGFQI